MTENPCPEAVLTAEHIALEMYQFAALMLGSEADALRLVENTVAAVDVDPCAEPVVAETLVRNRVIDGALEIMRRRDPASFSSVPEPSPGAPCIEDDTTPLSRAELSDLIGGAGRSRLRAWLDRLSQAQRAVFVQRAVLGQDNAATAQAISRIAWPSVWTPEAVGILFREVLCSLASSLAQSASGVTA